MRTGTPVKQTAVQTIDTISEPTEIDYFPRAGRTTVKYINRCRVVRTGYTITPANKPRPRRKPSSKRVAVVKPSLWSQLVGIVKGES